MSLPGIHGVTMSFNHLRVPRDCALASPALADAHHAHGHGSGKRTQFLAVSGCHASQCRCHVCPCHASTCI
jgi:hypothetical protein